MSHHHRRPLLLSLTLAMTIALIAAFVLVRRTQAQTDDSCDAVLLGNVSQGLSDTLSLDFEADYDLARDNLFRLGLVYAQLARDCGYEPTEQQVSELIDLTLHYASIEDVLLSQAVGEDTVAALVSIDGLFGDSQAGQLLYNGIQPGLDGQPLGCSGCHNGVAAPLTAGTWTRVDEIRLQQDELAGMTVREYLVESIVQPQAYIVDEYRASQMPLNFGVRLEPQQLADLVAYLESQDQLLEDIITPEPLDNPASTPSIAATAASP